MKKKLQKIVVLTCYDYSMAKILDEAGVDILLVGDSLAMVMMGEKDTKSITLQQMLPYAVGVKRGAKKAKVVFDMPIGTYKTPQLAYKNAVLIKRETGIEIMKIEGRPDVVEYLVKKGFEVMGHTGLKPQTAKKYAVTAKNPQERTELLREAKEIEKAGAASIVLECIPATLATQISETLAIPTIGIGAGKGCDGQVLVLYDLLKLYSNLQPRFVRSYVDFGLGLKKAVQSFIEDVRKGKFPSAKESY